MRRIRVQEISMGSMADIAFLLLIFFLVATTMETDKGILRKLPPLPVTPSDSTKVRDRNILVVLINRNNKIMVEGEELDIGELRSTVKEFILNPDNKNDLPVIENIEVDYFGIVPVTTKHVVSLRSDRGTTYEMYIAVQNEIVAAYNELRNRLAMQKWNVKFEDLPDDKKEAITTIYPMKISEAEPN